MLFLILIFNNKVYPANVTFIDSLNFGNIIANPYGETIEIDATKGPTTTLTIISSGFSHIITNGSSGIIRIYSDIPGQTISLDYPATMLLKTAGGEDIIIDGISERSKTSATSSSVGDIDFDIGGLMHINPGQIGADTVYSGTITVIVNISNP